MTTEHLPDGSAVVTLDDGMDWSPLDVFTWVAYRELRRVHCNTIQSIQFPRTEWSCDWVCWPPPCNLATALGEIATGVLCLYPEGSDDEARANSSRRWARKVMARNMEDARGLADALASDFERSRLASMDYENAREDVHAALRAGRLQVWARKAHGMHKSNRNADHEPLGAGVFTLQPREVNEGAWVGVTSGDDGPWWDEARFKPDQVLALWPAGGGIGTFANPRFPFPDAARIAPWVAASWQAFGTLDAPGHVVSHRSFDHGTKRLPSETRAQYEARLDEHRRFDAAERKVLDLLASGRITAKGLPPAAPASHHPARSHIDVPADAFLTQEVALTQDGKLISRLDVLSRAFPPLDVRGSKDSPEFPLWHDLLIEAAGLREVWLPVEAPTDIAPPFAPAEAAVPKPPCDYSESALAAWFILRVKAWRKGAAPPTEAKDFKDARLQFGDISRDRFREIRRIKTPPAWRKPGPRRPRN